MDLWQTLRAVLRRWYVFVPLVALTVIAAVVVRSGVQPGYTVGATAIVLPPSSARVPTSEGVEIQPVNPLLNFNASTQVAARALTILASGPEFQQRVSQGRPLAAYSVSAPPREPILSVQTESRDRALALSSAQAVLDGLQAELDRQQQVDSPEQRITVQTLAQPGLVSVDRSRLRAFVVTLAVGLLVSLAVSIAVDGALSRRSRTPRRLPAGAQSAGSPHQSGQVGAADQALARPAPAAESPAVASSAPTSSPDASSLGVRSAAIEEPSQTR